MPTASSRWSAWLPRLPPRPTRRQARPPASPPAPRPVPPLSAPLSRPAQCGAAVFVATSASLAWVAADSYRRAAAADSAKPSVRGGASTPRPGRAATLVAPRPGPGGAAAGWGGASSSSSSPPPPSPGDHFAALALEETATLQAREASLRLVRDEGFAAERDHVRALLRQRGVRP